MNRSFQLLNSFLSVIRQPHTYSGCLCLLLVIACSAKGRGLRAAAPPYPQNTNAPEVLKVEPPNWWTGHSINPVRLLIRGRHLCGARIEASGTGIDIERTHINAAGTYLFADVRISPRARPGRFSLKITTDAGKAEAPFEVFSPLSHSERFAGLSADDVIYLIMPDRFSNSDPSNDNPPQSRGLLDRQKPRDYHGGDLEGIIKHLPYLKDLGVTAIWLTPIYDAVNDPNQLAMYKNQPVGEFHGYFAVDFYGVEEHFGDLAKLRELVAAAHRFGIKVIQDQVANHTGPYHPWVKDPPTPTWFNGTEAKHLDQNLQMWTLMDPHATPEIQKPTLEGWHGNFLPDLNQNDEEVARYLIQNTLWWLGIAGFDGIREDTLPYAPRRFWHSWMAAIKREHPKLTVVGEVFDGDPALVSFFQGGATRFDGIDSGVDTAFDFPLYFSIRRAFGEGKSIRDVAFTLSHDALYPNPNLLVTFIGLHDVPRFINEPGASIAGLKLAYTFIMTARGIPMIYYGDEIAMPGGADPDNRRDFPGGWPADPHNAFEARGRSPEQEAVFEHVRRLTHVRAELEPPRRGSMVNLEVSDQTYVYARVTGHDSVIVVLNNGPQPATVVFDVGPARLAEGTTLEDRLGTAPDVRVKSGKITVSLPARSASVYTAKNPVEK